MNERGHVRSRTWAATHPSAAETSTASTRAADRLRRLLYLIPRASGPTGVLLSEVADELCVDEGTVLEDLRQVQERDLYHPSGGADDIQISIGTARVRVWTAHDLSRPTKLTPSEALALWLGLEIVVRPYRIVHAEGVWYVLGHCERANAVRSFRLDRILGVEIDPERFEPPADFDPEDHLDVHEGRVLDSSGNAQARVRYSPVIARWIAEREAGEWQPDGSLVVRHDVADPAWLIRHVLQYAGEAEVLDPPALRVAVATAARRIAQAP